VQRSPLLYPFCDGVAHLDSKSDGDWHVHRHRDANDNGQSYIDTDGVTHKHTRRHQCLRRHSHVTSVDAGG
jgi:hypothetical protein